MIGLRIIFGDDPLIGYAFIAVGVVVAVAVLLSARRAVPRPEPVTDAHFMRVAEPVTAAPWTSGSGTPRA